MYSYAAGLGQPMDGLHNFTKPRRTPDGKGNVSQPQCDSPSALRGEVFSPFESNRTNNHPHQKTQQK